MFFQKGSPTRKIWYYQLNLTRNLGKTNPLNEKDLGDFITLQKTKAESDSSWTVDIKEVDRKTFDLSVKNPNKSDEVVLREPKEILEEMERLDKESKEVLESINKKI